MNICQLHTDFNYLFFSCTKIERNENWSSNVWLCDFVFTSSGQHFFFNFSFDSSRFSVLLCTNCFQIPLKNCGKFRNRFVLFRSGWWNIDERVMMPMKIATHHRTNGNSDGCRIPNEMNGWAGLGRELAAFYLYTMHIVSPACGLWRFINYVLVDFRVAEWGRQNSWNHNKLKSKRKTFRRILSLSRK